MQQLIYVYIVMSRSNRNPLLLQHPYAAQISGPSSCGKTWFVKELLCEPESPFDKILYFYSIWQPLYEQMPANTQFVEGLPEERPPFDQDKNTCFVFDDLSDKVSKCDWASQLYKAGCHHQGLSVVSLQQNVYTSRDQRLQCHYLILFDFPQDRGAVGPLARQLCPGHADRFIEMYRDATAANHGWFLVDMKKDRDPRLRFRRGWRDCYIEHCEI